MTSNGDSSLIRILKRCSSNSRCAMKTRKFRRRRCAIILLFNAIFIFIIFISSYHHTHRLRRLKELRLNRTSMLLQKQAALISNATLSQSLLSSLEDKKPDETLILFWTTYFGEDFREDSSWKRNLAAYSTCFEKCRIVQDKSYLGVSDAIVFHSRDTRKSEMPLVRSSGQVWVYLQQETPLYTRENLTEFDNVFNWTMTYRRDSDIWHPYFLIIPVRTSGGDTRDNLSLPTADSLNQIIKRKTKLVAWIVSNCDTKSKRENYVNQLEAFIPIDIYGHCGDYSCHRDGEGCLSEIARQYKFYLSFENSLCTDYITEKFSNAMQFNLVPVVYGGGDYNTMAPSGSFINANDFASPKALAEYLLLLDRNPKLYRQYFQWKTKYKIVTGDGWCSLCRKMAQQKLKPVLKSYDNLKEWWTTQQNAFSDNNNNNNEDSSKKGWKPQCQDPSADFLDKWNLLDNIEVGFKVVRRWIYKQFLGY